MAELARRIAALIRARGLMQAEAVVLLGVDQPKVPRFCWGYLTNIAAEPLMLVLRGWDGVGDVARKVPRSDRLRRLRVVEAT